ncbi:Cell wall mannoprotein CIS3 [Fulvia fulva]|uniref:Cell wall mannoprotein CIS3 n=1 Tax=Passalora fulva TaxID=5499 RepID=A0A1P8YXR6_PASFU|nr:Cell wall mannoprotein CIS3 [Fulvia fulva]AQA29298.1 hypothetical protein 5 [Fulvia fulva]KAK4637449.1 Cell wall mannoprotein CIS3 [Fulvia fulva]UJO12816.1 Cell wall mannoprotein CIS3 [Fulvia fulva]
MQYALTAVAFAAVAMAMPQGKAPPMPASSECQASYPGTFQIQVVNVTSSSNMVKRQDQSGTLRLTLNNGVLKDEQDRTGNIVANNQFQFDKPIQDNAKITEGWAACPNGTLVLGSDAVFKQCLSGNFYNLYDENGAGQCNEIYIQIINGGGAASAAPSATSAASVTQIGDGQAQAATSAAPVTQIGDGQVQASTGAVPVTQIGDGQIQAPTGSPVTQIGDGQIQAPTGSPVTQIGDGQIQAPTGAPVTQIGDGQIQAPTNGTSRPMPSVQPYTGAAAIPTAVGSAFGLAIGAVAMAML